MASYIHYEDYFKDKFIPEYERTKAALEKDCDMEKLNEQFKLLFGTTFLLLKYYIHNNGLYQFKELDVYKEVLRIDFLDNGDEWMKLLSVKGKPFSKEIYRIYKDNFFVFRDLRYKFEGLV